MRTFEPRKKLKMVKEASMSGTRVVLAAAGAVLMAAGMCEYNVGMCSSPLLLLPAPS